MNMKITTIGYTEEEEQYKITTHYAPIRMSRRHWITELWEIKENAADMLIGFPEKDISLSDAILTHTYLAYNLQEITSITMETDEEMSDYSIIESMDIFQRFMDELKPTEENDHTPITNNTVFNLPFEDD